MPSHALDLGIGVLELVLGAVVLIHFWRFRRGFPWLIALTVFFFLRGVDRLVVGFLGTAPDVLGGLLDPMIISVLVLLLFSIRRIVRALELAEDAAHLREREYQRALVDYRRLARHRLATPLTAVLLSARTLLELGPEDRRLRREAAEILRESVVRLEHVSLDPRSELAPDEQALQPSPSLEREA
jgi:signal transduction histidine kinase